LLAAVIALMVVGAGFGGLQVGARNMFKAFVALNSDL